MAVFATIALLAACTGGGGSTAMPPEDDIGQTTSEQAVDDLPAEGYRIERDPYGVPHIYGATLRDVSVGGGYAAAEDRLFQLVLFARASQGRVSEIFGSLTVDMDLRTRLLGYTEAERAARFARYPDEVRDQVEAYVEGINERISEVRTEPSLLPVEFSDLDVELEDWTVDDSVALHDQFVAENGGYGGRALEHATIAHGLVEEHGTDGLAMFDDLVPTANPDEAAMIPDGTPQSPLDLSEADDHRRLTDDARLGLDEDGDGSDAAAPSAGSPAIGTEEQLALIADPSVFTEAFDADGRGSQLIGQVTPASGSNALVIGPDRSASGGPILVSGPQVGRAAPPFLYELGVHAPGLDAVGMTIAGTGSTVGIGLSGGNAWTQVTGSGPIVDTYAEFLDPSDPERYEFDGRYEPMDCRDETHRVRGEPDVEQRVCRTRHGPVVAWDVPNERAYSQRRAFFDREDQDITVFAQLQEAEDFETWARIASTTAGSHAFFYAGEDGTIALMHPGNYPQRPKGVDLRLPQDGRGGSEWRGLVPADELPLVVDPEQGWVGGWHNQVSTDWPLEVHDPYYAARTRSLLGALDGTLAEPQDPVSGDPLDTESMDIDDVLALVRSSAIRDHHHGWFDSLAPSPSSLGDPVAAEAAQMFADWDGSVTDDDDDGLVDHPGVEIFAAWMSELRARVVNPVTGDLLDDLPARRQEATVRRVLWHALSPDATKPSSWEGWTDGVGRDRLLRETFERGVAKLRERFGDDPSAWRTEAPTSSYERFGPGGAVPPHLAMDRGSANHVIVFGGDEPRSLSVLPPGQSGFVDEDQTTSRHYLDQWSLYVGWCLKPAPPTGPAGPDDEHTCDLGELPQPPNPEEGP